MSDIDRLIFISANSAQEEASARTVVKKLVDRPFTRYDKERILRNKGVSGKELEDALTSFVPEVILPKGQVELAADPQYSFVVQSAQIALSYTDGRGPEDPHWHPDELEMYYSHFPFTIATRAIDLSGPHDVRQFTAGRLIVPARMCHYIDLYGQTEVISVRAEKEMKRISCAKCPLYEEERCKGLSASGDSFVGEHELVSLAEARMSRIS
jgi:hypothetical protein